MPARFRAIHPVFHASKLSTYSEPTIIGQKPSAPPSTRIDGHEEWEVEKILQHRIRNRKREFLVRWKGFTQGDDTWEPEANLQNAGDSVKEYLQSLPDTNLDKTSQRSSNQKRG